MQTELVREIAEAIVQQQLLLNWRFYALVLSLSLVGGAAGYWLAPYLRKRAETFATKADMQEILRQLAETTRTSEEIRAAIAQEDWAQREWRSIRRLKLEELLAAAYSLDQWLDTQQAKWLHGEAAKDDGRPMDKMKLNAALYFPDLSSEVNAVWMAHQRAFMFIVEIGGKGGAARLAQDAAAYGKALGEFKGGWEPHYAAARLALDTLERAASQLMPEIAGA